MGLLSTKNQINVQHLVNCVWKQWTCLVLVLPSVCCFKTVKLLANISIGTSRLCRNEGFAHIMTGIFKIFQLIHHVVVHLDIFLQQHGRLLCKKTAKSYCKDVNTHATTCLKSKINANMLINKSNFWSPCKQQVNNPFYPFWHFQYNEWWAIF